MANINLINKEGNEVADSLVKEWAVSIIAIILLLLSYGGLAAYNRSVVENTNNLNEEYKSQTDSLMESGKNVFDFQNRLETAKPLVSEKNYSLESLDQIEKVIIPGVYVESFTWDSEKEKIILECVAADYRLTANQIASFKKSDYFSDVVANETNNREDGKINLFLELTIKK